MTESKNNAELLFATSSAIFCILFIAMLVAYLTKTPTKVLSPPTILQGGTYQTFGVYNWNLQVQTDSCFTYTVPSSSLPGLVNFTVQNFQAKGPLQQLTVRNADAQQGDANFYAFSQTTLMLTSDNVTMPNGYTLINAPSSLVSVQTFVNTEEFPAITSLTIFYGDSVPLQASFTLCGWGG